jgi:hypothetical protein
MTEPPISNYPSPPDNFRLPIVEVEAGRYFYRLNRRTNENGQILPVPDSSIALAMVVGMVFNKVMEFCMLAMIFTLHTSSATGAILVAPQLQKPS